MVVATREKLRGYIDRWRIEGSVLDDTVFQAVSEINASYQTAAIALRTAGFCFEKEDPKTNRLSGWRYTNGIHAKDPVSFFISLKGIISDSIVRHNVRRAFGENNNMYDAVVFEMLKYGWKAQCSPDGTLYYVSEIKD